VLFTNAAFGLATGDTIYFLPGAHSWTTALTVNVAGVTLTGVTRAAVGYKGRRNQGSVKMLSSITSTTTAIFVTVADVEIANLHIIPASTLVGIQLSNAAADRCFIHDCTFNMVGTGDTNTIGIYLESAVNDCIIGNCFWHVEGSMGPGILALGATIDTIVENCTFRLGGDTAWADAIKVLAVSLGTVFRDIDFLNRVSGVAITDGIDITGATTDGGSTVLRCMFPVGCNLTNANVADNQCAENYTMQAAASVGGTLILST